MNTQRKYDIDKLLFRRQFILGPNIVDALISWKRIEVRKTLQLTVHPDLNCYQAKYENNIVTLLGYILDPYHPQYTDADIIDCLIRKLSDDCSLDNFIKYTYNLGGRWILIVDNGKEIRLFNDAAGLRQVFYTDVSVMKELCCASQPGVIADISKLEADAEALEFIEAFKKVNNEYWWPGDTSLYREIKHLLPNHYLDLVTGSSYRYWPDSRLDNISLDDSVRKNAEILQGLMRSASYRFSLALSLTAGGDTRLILASSRNIENIFYFTLMYWHLNEDSSDIQIPSRLLSKLGLRHNIIKCPPVMEDEFRKIYKRNVVTARDAYGTIAQGLYNYYPLDKVCVKGNVIPITKSHFSKRLSEDDRKNVNVQILTRLIQMEGNLFAERAYKKWISGLNDIYNIDILDLFTWEDRVANWQAMSQLEWDIVHEVFVPYNCRILLSNILSIHEKYRKPPDFIIHRTLMKYMWPELLSEPINPHKKVKSSVKKRITSFIIKVPRKLNIYKLISKEITDK